MREKLSSPFRKLRHFAFTKQGTKEAPAAIDERPLTDVAKCMQDAVDMRIKFEGLLTSGQTISGAAYDFSRSLQDMASFMVESFGEDADQEIGNIFSLLAKVQFEMSKLLDLFAAHVSKTIIKPTELMMNKIQQAEIMKNEYDEKRKLYILSRMEKQKGKSKRGKGSLGDRQTVMAEESIQEQANNLTLYMQSLTRGQSEHLVTQAVKYHSAHMLLFSKGLASISAIEPMIRQVALDRIIDRILSEEEASIDDFMHSSEMNKEGKVQKNDSETDSGASSSVTEQMEPPRYLSESSEEFYLRRSAINSKSAPISPLMYHRREARENLQESLDSEHESVTRYALPSPLNGSRRWIENKIMEKLSEKYANLNLNQTESEILEASKMKHKLDMPLNQVLLHRDQSIQVQKHEYSETKGSPNKSLLFVDDTDDVGLSKPSVEKGRRYTQSGPLVDSPSYNRRRYANVRRTSPTAYYEEYTPPLYKSGPISRSPLFSYTTCNLSPPPSSTPYISELHNLSPPLSSTPYISELHNLSPPPSSMPYISELHKLPLPPPGSTTPPKSPNHTPSSITYSAPLGKVKHAGFCQSGQISPLPFSTPSVMTRSLSIPTPKT